MDSTRTDNRTGRRVGAALATGVATTLVVGGVVVSQGDGASTDMTSMAAETETEPAPTAPTLPDTGAGFPDEPAAVPPWSEQQMPAFGRERESFGFDAGAQALDTTEATASEETGMLVVTATMADGSGVAAGTGMVLSADGEAVTNNHVIEGAASVEVTVVATGASYAAEVVEAHEHSDIAVLRLVDAEGLETVQADTSGVSVGDTVTAVGDANGDGGSLTSAEGVVTGLHRSITTRQTDGSVDEQMTNLIEIDGDIVAGVSGGALLDEDGEVVGMTTAASTGTPDITGYAIAFGKVLRIAERAE